METLERQQPYQVLCSRTRSHTRTDVWISQQISQTAFQCFISPDRTHAPTIRTEQERLAREKTKEKTFYAYKLPEAEPKEIFTLKYSMSDEELLVLHLSALISPSK